jgi:hypothetical protein
LVPGFPSLDVKSTRQGEPGAEELPVSDFRFSIERMCDATSRLSFHSIANRQSQIEN